MLPKIGQISKSNNSIHRLDRIIKNRESIKAVRPHHNNYHDRNPQRDAREMSDVSNLLKIEGRNQKNMRQ